MTTPQNELDEAIKKLHTLCNHEIIYATSIFKPAVKIVLTALDETQHELEKVKQELQIIRNPTVIDPA